MSEWVFESRVDSLWWDGHCQHSLYETQGGGRQTGSALRCVEETGVQPRSREDGQGLWEEGGSTGERKRDELGSEEEEARKDMPSKGTAWAKM